MLSILERTYCAVIAGASKSNFGKSKTVEVFTEHPIKKHVPNLPPGIGWSAIFLHHGSILLCGTMGEQQKCYQLDHGKWKDHSTLNSIKMAYSVATTQTATFIFGRGFFPSLTYEYLEKESTTWQMGKTEIPGGFFEGRAISVRSKKEIWLIGGISTYKRILSFNVKDHSFRELFSHLNLRRKNFGCAFIPNTKKVMITGGFDDKDKCLRSTEILDTENESVLMASPLNSKRGNHGMGIVTINGEDRLAVFGGINNKTYLNSVELYNTQTEKWENTDIKLKEANSEFGFLCVKLADVVS